MNRWHTLRTKPHKERQVASQLQLQGIDVFLPLIPVAGCRPAREQPLFASYLFARADREQAGPNCLKWTPGLHSVVEFGGEPAPVPDHVIGKIRASAARIREQGGLQFDDLRPGDSVRIISGPLGGYEALFDLRLSSRERVRVLLTLTGPRRHSRTGTRYLPVELNAGDLRRVPPRPARLRVR